MKKYKKNHQLLRQADKAVQAVIRYEKRQGRKAIDVSSKLIGYDVQSRGRLIEVKSRPTNLSQYIGLHGSLLKKLGKNVSRYYIYLVWDFGPKTKLTIIPPEIIFENLEIHSDYRIRQKAFRKIKPLLVGKI